MYVKVLYDKEAKKGLLSGNGFSCLVEGKILFDTGEASGSLVENMNRMMVSVDDLEGVVISHDKWDHTSGLWEILRKKRGLKVYACPASSDSFKKCVKELGGKLVLVKGPMEIAKNIFVTGEIKGKLKEEELHEQALVVKGEKGVSVITGCAHYGIVEIIKTIKKKLKLGGLYMVFGGFHLDGLDRDAIGQVVADFKTMGVVKAGPTHCSGEKARRVFGGRYHGDFVPIKAGHIIQL